MKATTRMKMTTMIDAIGKRRTILPIVIAAALLVLPGAVFGGQETTVTAGVEGIFPPGTSFGGLPIDALQAGFGLEIEDGSALGEFCVVLVGLSLTGIEQTITIEGKATAGAQTAPNMATFSGTCTVDLGNGTLPSVDVPFTASMATNAESQGSIGLVIGATTLPEATISGGAMTIRVPATVTPLPSP
jgi:hypothetical protein